MKYSAAILLALFSIGAASVLRQRDESSEQSRLLDYWNRHRNGRNDNDWNSNENQDQTLEDSSFRKRIWNNDDDVNNDSTNKWDNNRRNNNNDMNNNNVDKRNKWHKKHNRNNDNDWNNDNNDNGNKWNNKNNKRNHDNDWNNDNNSNENIWNNNDNKRNDDSSLNNDNIDYLNNWNNKNQRRHNDNDWDNDNNNNGNTWNNKHHRRNNDNDWNSDKMDKKNKRDNKNHRRHNDNDWDNDNNDNGNTWNNKHHRRNDDNDWNNDNNDNGNTWNNKNNRRNDNDWDNNNNNDWNNEEQQDIVERKTDANNNENQEQIVHDSSYEGKIMNNDDLNKWDNKRRNDNNDWNNSNERKNKRNHRRNDNDWNDDNSDERNNWNNKNNRRHNNNNCDDNNNDNNMNNDDCNRNMNNNNWNNKNNRRHNNNNCDDNNNDNNMNNDDCNRNMNDNSNESEGWFGILSFFKQNRNDVNDDLNIRRNKINWDNDDINNNRIDNISLKQKQKVILQLLSNLQQKNTNMNLAMLGNQLDLNMKIDRFDNKKAVIKFLKTMENNELLPKNEVFSLTNQIHQNQAAQLFTLLYSARDWTTLKQTAAWARDRVNTDMFAYVLTAVVLNHPTTQGIIVPALYEILPHAFIPATTMQELYKAKLSGMKSLTVRATYTNENRKNKNYNKGVTINNNDETIRDMENNKGMNKVSRNVIGTHNPNKLFADNDGSLVNKAGIIENLENRLSYFTEDIGVNDLHARFHIQYPLFLGQNTNKNYYTSNVEDTNNVNINTNKLDVKRGEAFYFVHQQLYARYVLERLSNDLSIPLAINLEKRIETGYNPNLQYSNGKAVPARPPNTKLQLTEIENVNNNNNLLPNNNQAENPKLLEKRLLQVAESGIVLNKDGTKTKLNKMNGVGVLANLIAAPASSLNPDYYGDYFSTAKNVIGNVVDPNNQNGVAPGAIANHLTAARDPAYYQLLAKLNNIFKSLQNKLGPYTQSQLNLHGVKIEKIEVSDLVTYLDTTTVNVNNALMVKNRRLNKNDNIDDINNQRNMDDDMDTGDFNVKIQRLTNKPFEIRMTVLSNKDTNAIVRIFLGPKFDSNGQLFTLAQASQYFIQLDQFKVKLNNGKNIIQKNSRETNVNAQNPVSMRQMWNRISQGELINVKKADHQVLGLPLRSQLPKGKENGQEFILYAIINGLNDNINTDDNDSNMDLMNSSETTLLTGNNKLNSDEVLTNDNRKNMDGNNNLNNKIIKVVKDNRSAGFPLDRPIVDVNHNTPNQYFKTVIIYHKINNN